MEILMENKQHLSLNIVGRRHHDDQHCRPKLMAQASCRGETVQWKNQLYSAFTESGKNETKLTLPDPSFIRLTSAM
jgi:hypothetical protein